MRRTLYFTGRWVSEECDGRLWFGGDSSSQANQSTTNQTTNNVQDTDRRIVASDQAVALNGDGNRIDRSQTSLTQIFDSSNRSTNFADSSNRSTNFADSSNRSTNFADSSNRSTYVNSSTNFSDSSNRSVFTSNTVTDYGSVGAALNGLGQMSKLAIGLAGNAVDGAYESLKSVAATNDDVVKQGFALASTQAAASVSSSAAVLGLSKLAIEGTQAAYANAKDGGQQSIVKYALAGVVVLGVVVVAMGRK